MGFKEGMCVSGRADDDRNGDGDGNDDGICRVFRREVMRNTDVLSRSTEVRG